MNDPKEKKDILEPKGAGNTTQRGTDRNDIGTVRGQRGFDFQGEYKQSFNKALFVQKMAETSLAYLDRMNPSKEILPQISNLDDTQQKDIKEALSADMQEWLEMWRAVLNEGKSLPVDLIGMASDLIRKDRSRFK